MSVVRRWSEGMSSDNVKGVGGYSYLLEPLWWAGMITMVVGEIANFAAYAFAPAILALDTFNTTIVSPMYYVMFTSLTILASVIMFKDWDRQTPTQIITEMCGFVTILSGTFLLHKTKDMVDGPSLSTSMSMRSLKHEEEEVLIEGIPLKRQDSLRIP
ncbi:putative magnesium transporter NIPA5 [Hibiscus syriacus]|uniref:Probable magnesium transporter n=1 Tax=Hibiscus syriacus TaxID=106335 RepID=A0A6A3BYY6_HIBSY|nr:putative magnesium transporter NIPA5 [Hibiscus syriacus]